MNAIPNSVEVERAVVGALLDQPKLQSKHAPELSPILFYDHRHVAIVQTMLSILDAEREPADFPRLSAHLSLNDQTLVSGGPQYLTDLISARDIPFNISAHLRTLRGLARLRRQQVIGKAMQELAVKPGADPEEISRRCSEQFDEPALHDPADETGTPEQVAMAVENQYNRAQLLAQQGKRYAGLDFGFPDLCNFVAGLEAELTVIGARPSVGKTKLAEQIAINVASRGIGVGIFTMEMTATQLGIRMVTDLAGVDPEQRRRGTLSDEDHRAYTKATSRYAALPIWLFTDRTIPAIRSRMMRHLEKHPVGLWIFDHLHKIRGGPVKDVERLNYIAEQVSAFPIEFQTPALLLAQLNRECESRPDKRPQLSDLRGAGGIEEHSVNVWFIYRPGRYQEILDREKDPVRRDVLLRSAQVLVEKQREGQVGVVNLGWDPDRAVFVTQSKQLEYYPSHDNE
jgi:replicative DNA helicase